MDNILIEPDGVNYIALIYYHNKTQYKADVVPKLKIPMRKSK